MAAIASPEHLGASLVTILVCAGLCGAARRWPGRWTDWVARALAGRRGARVRAHGRVRRRRRRADRRQLHVLRDKGPAGTLLDVMGPWPWYIGSALVLALVFLLILDVPFRASRRRRSRAAARGDLPGVRQLFGEH